MLLLFVVVTTRHRTAKGTSMEAFFVFRTASPRVGYKKSFFYDTA